MHVSTEFSRVRVWQQAETESDNKQAAFTEQGGAGGKFEIAQCEAEGRGKIIEI